MKDITVMDQCTVRTERIVDDEDLIKLRKEMANIVSLFKENTDAIGKIQDELQEMPGGYRNSQDIKHLKGRIERLEARKDFAPETDVMNRRITELEKLLQSGGRVTVHSRLNDMEVSIKKLESKDPSVYDDRIAKLAARVSDIEFYVQSIRANKFATQKEMREADDYLAKQCIKLEECCKNTVAAGKELEKRCDFVDAALKNHDSRLNRHKELIDGFRTNVQHVVRDILKSL